MGNETVKEEVVAQAGMTEINLDVLLNPGGGGTVTPVPPIPRNIEGAGIIWTVNGAIVNEIRLVVGRTVTGFKLTVLDEDRDEHGNERVLPWTTGGTGANLPIPPPPPEVSHMVRFGQDL